jgi:hypothetical protein
MAGSCVHNNETFNLIKREEFPDKLKGLHLKHI